MDASGMLQKCWLVLMVFWLLSAIGRKRPVYRQPIVQAVPYRVVMLAGAVMTFWTGRAWGILEMHVSPASAAMEWLAVCVGIAGFAIAIWARILLGGEWSGQVTLKEDHQLISGGPYSVVRHPIYSGLLLAVMGTALAGGVLHMYLGMVLLFAGFWWKSRIEEALLLQAMGSRYVDYQRRTWALIPGLL